MDAYIARQPVFNQKREVTGYELLYRDGVSGNQAIFTDGDKATSRLLSDAITLFGLPKLTNRKPAYVNFTENLIMNDFVLLARPQEVVVEILESVKATDALLNKLEGLKKQGYVLALDDYTGDSSFDRMLPYIDILKVDFRLTTPQRRKEIVHRSKKQTGLRLLAEKVETQEEFEQAADLGYQLFQGYFFQKPVMFGKKLPSLAATSYGRILKEMQNRDINLDNCARIIHADPVLTYRIMQKAQTMQYYRGNIITVIQQALMLMGTDELRRWIILLLARENNVTRCDELVRESYLRGIFAERLLAQTEHADRSEEGFLLGMFSLLDKILGLSMEEILQDVELGSEVKDALLGVQENRYTPLLQYIIVYEMGNPSLLLPNIGIALSSREVARLYMRCLIDVDKTFGEIGDGPTTCRQTKKRR